LATELATGTPRTASGTDEPTLRPPRVVLSGATGRLGRAFAELAQIEGIEIVGAIAGPRGPRELHFAGASGQRSLTVERAERLPMLLRDRPVYVGCATAEAEAANLEIAVAANCPIVLATTGWSETDERQLQRYESVVPIVRDANFSLGLAWLRATLDRAPPLPPGFDVGLVEAHRRGKRDRPSGTSKSLAALSGAAAGLEVGNHLSLRLGELPGVHQLWWSGGSELLRVEHLVLDRRAFAAGMAAAVRWLDRTSNLAPGGYRLLDVLTGGREGL
jgi:4-hydroxy-tetrahydrodipicolinate reductase